MKTWRGQVTLERLPKSAVMLREHAADAYASGDLASARQLEALADAFSRRAEKVKECER